MTMYKFEVVATYSDVIEIEAESEEKARTIADETPPNWISFGDKMAYLEQGQSFLLSNEENR